MLTKCEDYIDRLKEKYPDVDEKDIELIIKHGVHVLYRLTNAGADVHLQSNDFLMHFGVLTNDPIAFYKMTILKWQSKYRIKFKLKERLKGLKWDGYYYLSCKEKDPSTALKLLFKLKEDACLRAMNFPYIYKIKLPDTGWTHKIDGVDLSTAEYVEKGHAPWETKQ